MKDKITGKLEELKGRLTGDRATELKGKGRQTVGEARRLARDARDELSGEGEPAPSQQPPLSQPPTHTDQP